MDNVKHRNVNGYSTQMLCSYISEIPPELPISNDLRIRDVNKVEYPEMKLGHSTLHHIL